MGVVTWIVLGLIAGVIADKRNHANGPDGVVAAMAVAVSGALLGGFIGAAAGLGDVAQAFDVGTAVVAAFVAVLMLTVYALILRDDADRRPPMPPR